MAITDQHGMAFFEKLAIYDVKNGKGCFKIMFVVGEPEYLIANVTSIPICFYNNINPELAEIYTRKAVVNIAMSKPLSVTVM